MFPGRSPVDGVAAVDPAAHLAALKRATMQAPDNYAPAAVDCPSTRPTIRLAASLSDNETAWLEARRNNTVWAMRNFLGRANITGLDTNAYIDSIAHNASELPNIGIAISGGGYRALMNGAGALAAFDNRTTNLLNTVFCEHCGHGSKDVIKHVE